MREFITTLIMVGIMLAYAVPGFLLVRVRAVKPESIPAFYAGFAFRVFYTLTRGSRRARA